MNRGSLLVGLTLFWRQLAAVNQKSDEEDFEKDRRPINTTPNTNTVEETYWKSLF